MTRFPWPATIALLAAASFAAGAPQSSSGPFRVGPLSARPGEAVAGFLPVPALSGEGAEIPVTVIRGARPGKVLALVAGVHGFEYPPILALYRVKRALDPKALSGTVILVHIANPGSFRKRTIYFNPADGKNLNRVFPGDAGGTLSQRMAFVLNEEVVKKCDALVDLHCGDGNESLIPYSYWMVQGDPAMDARTRELTVAFGLRHVIIDATRGKVLAESKYLANTAILQGKPAVTTESGDMGGVAEEDVERNVKGVFNVLRLYGMVEGKPEVPADTVWIDRYEVVNSPADGLFTPRVAKGASVAEGQLVGEIRDYLGAPAGEVRAPFAGIILYILGTPPANKGEPLFEVGRIRR